jgi:hypothetical protein
MPYLPRLIWNIMTPLLWKCSKGSPMSKRRELAELRDDALP